MTKQEFIDRTSYIPTDEEFEVIHNFYMNNKFGDKTSSFSDKDFFCLRWTTFNEETIRLRKQKIVDDTIDKVKSLCGKALSDIFSFSTLAENSMFKILQEAIRVQDAPILGTRFIDTETLNAIKEQENEAE